MGRIHKSLVDAVNEPVTLTLPHLFTPRAYQLPFLRAMDSGIKRACWVVHRRSGKTKTVLNLAIKKAFERVGAYYHCFPEYGQGRKIVWDGIDKDGNKFLDHIPMGIRESTNNSEMKIKLINGSLYQIIGADNYDSLVGPNPVGIILDEWAVSDRYPQAWDYFRPILVENGGWAAFPFTPRGRNHGWNLYQMALSNPNWFCQLLTTDDTGAINQDDIQRERESGMSESMIQQEFYCSFLASMENILIPFEFINQALRRDTPYMKLPRLAGGDCARFGDDRSSLVIRQGHHVIHGECWKNLDNVQLAGRYIDRYRSGMYDAIAIDVIGMPGVYDIVKSSGVPCVAVNVSESASVHPERFHRMRDELWWKLREFFQEQLCSISKGIKDEIRRDLVADIQDIRYSYKGITGQILVERKDEMKKRLGFSPDLGDALCCTFAPGLESKVTIQERTPFGRVQAFGAAIPPYDPLTFGLA